MLGILENMVLFISFFHEYNVGPKWYISGEFVEQQFVVDLKTYF